VITDLGVLRPAEEDGELELTAVHPGVDVESVRDATGWTLRVRDRVEVTEPATELELATLRSLREGVRA
jgi:glutaconate CoA-transferase subunit B